MLSTYDLYFIYLKQNTSVTEQNVKTLVRTSWSSSAAWTLDSVWLLINFIVDKKVGVKLCVVTVILVHKEERYHLFVCG